jgi:hypothetical protein
VVDENGNDNGGKEARNWERQLSWRNAFLDQWRTELAPVDAQIALATESTTSLALTGLRSGYLLNAGALIALPAFIEIFKKLESGDIDLFVFAAIDLPPKTGATFLVRLAAVGKAQSGRSPCAPTVRFRVSCGCTDDLAPRSAVGREADVIR